MNRYPASITGLLFAALLFVAGAQAAPVDQNVDAQGVAIKGYDPVAYFKAGKAMAGDARYTALHNGATYRFASAVNRDTFKASPDKYAPQYGGFCAMGTALGKKLEIDPEAWKIVDGKLYLNLNKDVQKKWLSDIPGHLSQANTQWPKIRAVPAADLK